MLCYPHLIYSACTYMACRWASFLNKVTVNQKISLGVRSSRGNLTQRSPSIRTTKFINLVTFISIFFCRSCLKSSKPLLGHNALVLLIGLTSKPSSNNANVVCPQFPTTIFRRTILCFDPDLWNSVLVEKKILLIPATYIILNVT